MTDRLTDRLYVVTTPKLFLIEHSGRGHQHFSRRLTVFPRHKGLFKDLKDYLVAYSQGIGADRDFIINSYIGDSVRKGSAVHSFSEAEKGLIEMVDYHLDSTSPDYFIFTTDVFGKNIEKMKEMIEGQHDVKLVTKTISHPPAAYCQSRLNSYTGRPAGGISRTRR